MKSKKKQNIVRVLFLLVLFFVGNYYLTNLINNKVNREINDYTLTNVDILGTSGHWNLAPFVIDDTATGVGAHNWTWAESQPWCSGSGTFEEPYLIENVTIDGGNSGSCLTIINSYKYFIVRNCKLIESGSGTYDAGIHLDHVGNGTLIDNNCSLNNNAGIILYEYCFNNTISGNYLTQNTYISIWIRYSDDNNILDNKIVDNFDNGVHLYHSNNNTVNDNEIINNNLGIRIHASEDNNVSNNDFFNNSYGISLRYGHNAKIFLNNISGNTNGIYIDNTRYLEVYENAIENGVNDGIRIHDVSADNNTIYDNNINSNGRYGVFIQDSGCQDNEIFLNNFDDNNINAFDNGTDNEWDNGVIGNYWSDYPGYDNDFDGIGDTPYLIAGTGGGQDNYPIWTFQSPIHIDDSPASPIDWAWAESQPWCSGSGTFSDPYVIDGLNITARGVGNGILIENSYKYFIVRNCKLIESGSGTNAGIYLDHVGNGTLINNNCSFNNANGIFLYYSDNNTVSGNTANNNSDYGIRLYKSDNNTISGNTANNNQENGIYLKYSDNNTVSGNTAKNNRYYGISLRYSDNNTVSGNNANDGGYGISIFSSDKNIVSGNTANNIGGYGISLRYSNNNTVSGNNANNGGYGIWISNSDNTTVSGNTVNNNQNQGIILYYSDNNNVSGNSVNNNQDYGISIELSNSTTISENNIDNNVNYGIIIESGYYNLIYENYFNNNNINAYDNGTDNEWDNGVIGNYWDDYAGVDAKDDGIGDTPYLISGIGEGQDNYPIWADGDDITPVITIISPLPDSVFDLVAPYYNISIDELNLDTIWYTLDGGITNYTVTDLTGTFNQLAWEALSEGSLTIRFYASDTAGNIGFIDVEVIIEIPEDLDGLPGISFGNYYIIFTFITILSFIILEKRKKKKP